MMIRPIGQSGYILQSGRSQIVIDPYLSDSVNHAFGRPRLLPVPVKPEEICCDAVVCTHNHLDHLDPDTVKQIRGDQLFITTDEGCETLRALGKQNAASLHWGESVQAGNFELTAVFADHTVDAFGLIVRAEGKTLYFSGDTLFHEGLFETAAYQPDIAFLCINGRLGNMNVEEALKVAQKLGAKVNVPNHYDMFASNSENPLLFTQHISGGLEMEFNRSYSLDELFALAQRGK